MATKTAQFKKRSEASLASDAPSLDEVLTTFRQMTELADKALRRPLSREQLRSACRLDGTIRPDGTVADGLALMLHPLLFRPSDLIQLHGTCVLFHPLVQNAISRLVFEANRPFIFKNRTAERLGWPQALSMTGPDRDMALRDDSPNPYRRIARAELKRIFDSYGRGRAYPAKYRDLRLLLDYEALLDDGIKRQAAKQRIAAKHGRKPGTIDMALARGKELRSHLLETKK